MFCKNCGQALNANQAICIKCGTAVGTGNAFCYNCGSQVPAGAAVCLSCGVALNQNVKKVPMNNMPQSSFCPNCGNPVSAGAVVCLHCGSALNQSIKAPVNNTMQQKFCPNCGNPISAGAVVCLRCGAAVAPMKNAAGGNLNGHDKTSMALLAFFLGGLGIHNFVMGETKKGIVKIVADLVCGLGALLGFIDFIRILTNSYVVDPDKLF